METKAATKFSERLELIKFKLKLTNSQLAKAAGVSGQGIADIINGVVENPRVALFIGISQTYQINYEWLLEGTGPMLKSELINSDGANSDTDYGQKLRIRDAYIAELVDELRGKPEGVSEEEAEFVMGGLVDDKLGQGGKMISLAGWNRNRSDRSAITNPGTPAKPDVVFGGNDE